MTREEWDTANLAHEAWIAALPEGKSFLHYSWTVDTRDMPYTGAGLMQKRAWEQRHKEELDFQGQIDQEFLGEEQPEVSFSRLQQVLTAAVDETEGFEEDTVLTEEEVAAYLKKHNYMTKAALPDKVDLRDLFPNAFDQGNLNAGTACSVAAAAGYAETHGIGEPVKTYIWKEPGVDPRVAGLPAEEKLKRLVEQLQEASSKWYDYHGKEYKQTDEEYGKEQAFVAAHDEVQQILVYLGLLSPKGTAGTAGTAEVNSASHIRMPGGRTDD